MPAIKHQFPLREHNSFGIDVRAAMYANPESTDQLVEIITHYKYGELPLLIIGEGSNLLFKEDFEGLVLNPGMRGIDLVNDEEGHVDVRVGAAESWDSWVQHANSKGWYGLENLSLIPGSVGAAPVQNIGAYGIEMKDFFIRLEAWDLKQQKEVHLHAKDCKFGYRSSVFKTESQGRYIITHVLFRLNKQPHLQLDYGQVKQALSKTNGSSPMDLRNTIIKIRSKKLPDLRNYGNAGSFFKNPLVDRLIFKCIRVDYPDIPSFHGLENQVKIPAAWLIEQAGWKGKRIGNVGTWPSQPLVIVNYGGATGQEIIDFSEKIRNEVDKMFGIYLEREVSVI